MFHPGRPSQFDVTAVTAARDFCHMQEPPNPATLLMSPDKPYLESSISRQFQTPSLPIDIKDGGGPQAQAAKQSAVAAVRFVHISPRTKMEPLSNTSIAGV